MLIILLFHILLLATTVYNERSRRICDLCNLNTLEDEYHFLLACPRFRDLRQKYFKRYYYTWPSIHKFIALMNSKSPSVIKNISKFLIEAFDRILFWHDNYHINIHNHCHFCG